MVIYVHITKQPIKLRLTLDTLDILLRQWWKSTTATSILNIQVSAQIRTRSKPRSLLPDIRIQMHDPDHQGSNKIEFCRDSVNADLGFFLSRLWNPCSRNAVMFFQRVAWISTVHGTGKAICSLPLWSLKKFSVNLSSSCPEVVSCHLQNA
jgi:hypothetical protein